MSIVHRNMSQHTFLNHFYQSSVIASSTQVARYTPSTDHTLLTIDTNSTLIPTTSYNYR